MQIIPQSLLGSSDQPVNSNFRWVLKRKLTDSATVNHYAKVPGRTQPIISASRLLRQTGQHGYFCPWLVRPVLG